MTTSDSVKHHHRSSLKQNNKAFKGTTAAKRAELRGKLFKNAPVKRTGVKQIKGLSKKDRLNKAQLLMESKREALMQDTRIYAGPNGLPRALSFIPLTRSARAHYLAQEFLSEGLTSGVIYSEKQKRRFQILPVIADLSDHLAVIDQVSQADTVIFVVDCTITDDQIVGDEGLTALSVIRATGFSSAMIVLLEDSSVPLKKRRELEEQCRSFFRVELPNVETFFTFDVQNIACKKDLFMFTMANVNMKGISWRQMRPYMIIDSVDDENNAIVGYVRGGSMNANQVVAIPGVGNHFTISSVRLLASKQNGQGMQTDDFVAFPDNSPSSLNDDSKRFDTVEEINRQATMSVVCDDAIMEEKRKFTVAVPAGTSSYQASWIAEVGSESDQEEGLEDEDLIDGEGDEQSEDDSEEEDYEEVSVDEQKSVKFAENDVEMDTIDGDDHMEALQSHRQASKSNKKFPHEIELDEDGSAKDRLKKYRAVKSLRTSEWDLTEGLPIEYSQVFAFQNYKLTRKRASQLPDSPFTVGTRVMVQFNEKISVEAAGRTAYFLLPHEQHNTVLNFTVKRAKSAVDAISSKERMLLVAGPRRMWVNPIFSEHTSNQQLHKMLRELPEDGIHVGTCYGPVTFDPCPVLLFRQGSSSDRLELVLTGAILSNDPNRVILKRITLTGTPFKIHKRVVVVRFMFFNAADVNYFKPVELMTRLYRRGHIKESLGTHGYMKCMFDKQIQHHDTVFMHLFKRVFPKHSFN